MKKLIVGLGNPGEKYQHTRHNIGFMVAEKISLKFKVQSSKFKYKKFPFAEVYIFKDFILAKPLTFMNNSGSSVANLSTSYLASPVGGQLTADSVWVIHDDIDLPLGKIRIRIGGASAGHNGVDSIIKALGTDKFVRFRLGIGRGKMEKERTMDQNLHRRWVERYVLSPFREDEGGEVRILIKKAAEAVELALKYGLEKAMNKFN